MQRISLKTKNNTTLALYKWAPDSPPKGSVQIIHGMASHAKRWDNFAKFLTTQGFIVYADDHRGHGETASSQENYGSLPKNGWQLMVNDEKELYDYIKKENRDIPHFIISHSMGSFIIRDLLTDFDKKINGVIISGTGQGDLPLLYIATEIARIQKLIKGPKFRSKLLDKMSFGKFNAEFKPNRTEYDWVNSDSVGVDQYIKDPYCGGIFTTNFYYEMFKGVKKIYKQKNINKIRKDIPLFIISGSKCPVGENSKGVMRFVNYLKQNGSKVDHKIYEGFRHEIFQETNKQEVYNDVLKFIESNM